MRRALRWWLVPLAAVLVCGLGNTIRAAEEEKHASPTDQKVYDMLVAIIDEGADLYNTGDQAGCYRLYEGALKALQPLGHDDWSKAIAAGLAEADRTPSLGERAFVLRRVIDHIRFDIHPRKGKTTRPETTTTRPPVGQPTPKRPAGEAPQPTTLWERLGGEKGVRQVVDDLVAIAAKDPKVDFFRGGKYKPSAADVEKLKDEVVAWISYKTGGPIPYTGESMKQVHKGMGITNAEFDAFAADLRKALEKNGVKGADLNAVMGAAAATRHDIVEKTGSEEKGPGTKGEEKKPPDKTGTEKKPGGSDKEKKGEDKSKG